MDFYNNNQNNYYAGGFQNPYLQQQMVGYPGTPMVQQPIMQPQNINAITEEEIKLIAAAKPNKLDINIAPEDNIRAMCTHKHNGRDMVQLINDGTDDVFCPICQERWNPTKLTKEEITNVVDTLIAQMQNSKWAGDLNTSLVRDYYPMIPLLKKFPDIYDYAMQSFNKYYSQNGYNFANEAAIYSQYNSLMGFAPQSYSNTYQQPMAQPMMQQPMAQPMMQQPVYGQMATQVNPMQTPYGVSQTPMNTQFVDQANAMMGGTVYNQPVSYAPAAVQQPAQAQPTTTPEAAETKAETTVQL